MAVDLEALDARLNATTFTLLGDTVTYTPSGGSPLTIKAIVDYSDNIDRFGGTQAVVGDNAVELARTDVAAPTSTDELLLPKRAGQIYQPKHFTLDESGDNWLIVLKKKPA